MTEPKPAASTHLWRAFFTVAKDIAKNLLHTTVSRVSAILNPIVDRPVAIISNIGSFTKKIAATTRNILGYLLDKMLFGSPGLKDYIKYGPVPEKIQAAIENAISNDQGWSPTNSAHPIVDNVFGTLGLGLGLLNLVNQFGVSCYFTVRKYSHILDEHGVFGKTAPLDDPRPLGIKIAFNLLALPTALTVILPSNMIDAFASFAKNWALSFYRITALTYNLLGQHGVFGERRAYDSDADKDQRHPAAKIIFGVLAAPFTLLVSIPGNTIDVIATFGKNIGLSYYRLTRASFNLLGEHGIFGVRQSYESDSDADKDKRHIAVKVIFAGLAFPFVAISSLLTNTLDLVCAYFKHYQKTIVEPMQTLLPLTFIPALIPFYLLRKVVLGFHNVLLRHLQDRRDSLPFNASRFLRGLLNIVSFGVFSVVKKSFSALTGYRKRFGFGISQTDRYAKIRTDFKNAMEEAANGKFAPNDFPDKKSSYRSILHIFGFQNRAEKVLKGIYDAFEERVQNIPDYPNDLSGQIFDGLFSNRVNREKIKPEEIEQVKTIFGYAQQSEHRAFIRAYSS